MQDKPLIRFEEVWKTYNLGEVELNVLKNVSLEIASGSFQVILGPSGSGKSTLLNLIGLLDVPTRGKVFFKGEDTSKFSEDELAKIRGGKIGFVFQQFNLLTHLSALENVMIPMLFQNISEKERRKRAQSLLSSVGLEKRILHRPYELSGGEQQRTAIARALSNDPEVIVADEPTGNLDSKTGKIIMEALIDLHKKEKKTIIVVTHDSTIAEYSKEIISIKDGEIISNHQEGKGVLWGKKK